jgi:hypothetical protein
VPFNLEPGFTPLELRAGDFGKNDGFTSPFSQQHNGKGHVQPLGFPAEPKVPTILRAKHTQV